MLRLTAGAGADPHIFCLDPSPPPARRSTRTRGAFSWAVPATPSAAVDAVFLGSVENPGVLPSRRHHQPVRGAVADSMPRRGR